MTIQGLITAAPSSGSGKTVITLAILRALRSSGWRVGSLKIGPDYIDPQFQRLASGNPCRNYDLWSMREGTLSGQVTALSAEADRFLAEGVMGLFDGAADGSGSTADAAMSLGVPVLLIVDARGQSQSVAALVSGFKNYRRDTNIAGLIINRAGGERHRAQMAGVLAETGIPVLGFIPRSADLDLPSRHLGLVQAGEHDKFDRWIDRAADIVGEAVDLDRVLDLMAPVEVPAAATVAGPVPVLGEHIAVARDVAFAFSYDHVLDGWRRAGAMVSFFCPLENDEVPSDAGGVYLPGGYPELHAGTLAANGRFLGSLRRAADRGAAIYGECGGFMILGETLTDKEGREHPMAGLLPVRTSFAEPKLSLGYRCMTTLRDGPLGPAGSAYRGHEYHYARITASNGPSLFQACDAAGENVQAAGAVEGPVMGSFMHVIDRAP